MQKAGGTPVDVTAELDADVPSKPFGGAEEWAFAPDGKTLVFTAREAFVHDSARTQLHAVVAGGLLLSLLLFLITRSQVNARAAAEAASQQQQRLAREAHAAVQVRDEFLGIAAHELRTPLTSLSLQLQLLRRHLGPDTPPESGKLGRGVATAERQTTRLSRLVGLNYQTTVPGLGTIVQDVGLVIFEPDGTVIPYGPHEFGLGGGYVVYCPYLA